MTANTQTQHSVSFEINAYLRTALVMHPEICMITHDYGNFYVKFNHEEHKLGSINYPISKVLSWTVDSMKITLKL